MVEGQGQEGGRAIGLREDDILALPEILVHPSSSGTCLSPFLAPLNYWGEEAGAHLHIKSLKRKLRR